MDRFTFYKDPKDKTMCVVIATCPFCKKQSSFKIKSDILESASYAIEHGARIQDALPQLTPSQRELLKTGICDKCWDSM